MIERRINVLVVDDSRVSQLWLTHVLEADPLIRVMAAVGGGRAAVAFVKAQTPDVVLMDIHMPHMDGFEATRLIMETHPVPIVVCTSTTNAREVATTFRAIEAGALACVEKPAAQEHEGFDAQVAALQETVKLMSEVKVVRRWAASRPKAAAADVPRAGADVSIVGIGASTGGPQALQEILASLPKSFPVPILIVQHIAPGFLAGLAEWLNQTASIEIQIGAHGARPLPGHAYLAPDDFHMGLDANDRLRLVKEAPHSHLRPSVAHLFQSLAETRGASAVGVLLTGMGKDGAAELGLLKRAGAVTIAQDQQSSVVYGMPGEAVKLDNVTMILPADRIAPALVGIVGGHYAVGAVPMPEGL